MQRMAGMDAAFLYIETRTMHMHVVGVLVLDPTGSPGGFGIDEVTRVMADRILLVPKMSSGWSEQDFSRSACMHNDVGNRDQ